MNPSGTMRLAGGAGSVGGTSGPPPRRARTRATTAASTATIATPTAVRVEGRLTCPEGTGRPSAGDAERDALEIRIARRAHALGDVAQQGAQRGLSPQPPRGLLRRLVRGRD